MSQTRSRRILIAVGLFALALLLMPLVLRGWVARNELSGKHEVFHDTSYAENAAMLKCLITRQPGGLDLQVSTETQFVDSGNGLVVRIEDRGDFRVLSAWSDGTRPLTEGQQAQLKACLLRPGG